MAQKKIVKKDKSRKDDLDPNKDEFITKSMSFLDWAVERRMYLGVLVAVALVAAVAGIGINHYTEAKAAENSILLGEGLTALAAPVIPPREGSDIPAEVDDEVDWFESVEARATASLESLDKATAALEGTSVGMMATLATASAKYDNGKFDEAVAAYEKFIASSNSEIAWLVPSAREGLGHAYEAAGNKDKALETFEALAENAEGKIALFGKYNAARLVQAEEGGADKAKTLLKEVLDGITSGGEPGRMDFLFVEARERLLALDPGADVPDMPFGFGGLDGIDPAMLRQLMQAQQAAGGAN